MMCVPGRTCSARIRGALAAVAVTIRLLLAVRWSMSVVPWTSSSLGQNVASCLISATVPWWQPCQPAPSRPGVFSVGGPIETGGTFNIGETDEVELEIKRIEAVSQVQEALNEKLGYNLRESGKYQEMQTALEEMERLVARREKKKLMPAAMMWAAPPVSRSSMMKKEPELPNLGDPLPLPSFGREGMQSGVGSELCLGKFVDSGPEGGGVEEERKRRMTLSL